MKAILFVMANLMHCLHCMVYFEIQDGVKASQINQSTDLSNLKEAIMYCSKHEENCPVGFTCFESKCNLIDANWNGLKIQKQGAVLYQKINKCDGSTCHNPKQCWQTSFVNNQASRNFGCCPGLKCGQRCEKDLYQKIPHKDLWYNHIVTVDVSNVEECYKICSGDEKCKAFVIDERSLPLRCLTKSANIIKELRVENNVHYYFLSNC